MPELVGGAADVESSTETHLQGYPDVGRNEGEGRNIHFSVREHTTGGIVVGMAAHGGVRPFAADANEATQAWAVALGRRGPIALVLCRQGLPVLDPDTMDVRGAVIALIGTGSEVEVALGARDILAEAAVSARVVSLASFELFFERPQAQRDAILPPRVPRLAVEAASPFGWSVVTPDVVAMTTYGRSGKDPTSTGGSASPPKRSPPRPTNPEPMRLATAAHSQEDR
jgi:transketolase